MSERTRVLVLVLIMAAVTLGAAGVAIRTLYITAFEEQRARLVEIALSQARLIEAVARFDEIHSGDYPGGPEAATLSQIIDAQLAYEAFGKTGEFAVAKREGDSIVFLHRHRHGQLDVFQPVPFDSVLAEPMRRALLGKSGTVVGRDFRGEQVLAAHEPVEELGLGIVAKIDIAEIRVPFRRAGYLTAVIAILGVFAGAWSFGRISQPMIRRLEDHSRDLESTVEALQESEERFRSTFEQAAVGIAHVAPDGSFIRVNQRFCDIAGYSAAELKRARTRDITHPDDFAADSSQAQRVLAGEKRSFTAERRYLRKDASTIWATLTVSLVRSSSGEPKYFITVLEDSTERKRAEAALKESLGEKEVLLREVHHRVKNNMQTVTSMLYLQARKLDDPRVREVFRKIQSRVRAMALVHENLYQSGDLSGIDLKNYLTGLAKGLLSMYGTFGAKVDFEVIADDIALGIDDTVPCGLIINELISNSLKHAFPDDRDPWIMIEAKSLPDGFVSIAVRDNGVGLPNELDIQTTDSMGLRLVTGLAEKQLGGSLEVDRDHGTCFVITFRENRSA